MTRAEHMGRAKLHPGRLGHRDERAVRLRQRAGRADRPGQRLPGSAAGGRVVSSRQLWS